MSKFIVEGGRPLEGNVRISGSKNAALPIIAASILSKETSVLHDVPDITDVRIMASIIEDLGGKVEFENNTMKITPGEITTSEIMGEDAKKLRTSLLFLSGLLARKHDAKVVFPGGCSIGKRPIDTHLRAFEDLGAEVVSSEEVIHIRTTGLKANRKMRLLEMSVTGAENAIIAAVMADGMTEMRQVPTEPHVQDLCMFLNKMGAKISGIGTNVLTIEGVSELHGAEHTVTPDYIEVGTFVIAALVTKGHVKIENIVPDHLDIFWVFLEEMGAKFELGDDYVEIFPTEKLFAVKKVRSAVFPDFPTDLLAPMAVLLTQAEGISRIFETMFESRLNYIVELEKMRVNAEIINNHEAIIVGPAKLRGTLVTSWDLRAGTAMVLAGLAAEGTTEVAEIKYIDRGYENFECKLTKLGARITREM
ncbi:MAG: UDP-N-acetylglucosamine 1-carboxyvinyltransferase [Candidatus Gracilibacteria bacterium]